MKDYRKIRIWGKAHAVSLRIYALTREFPAEETHGLAREMRRAAVSIPSNIAEGSGRNGDLELAYFFGLARGSAGELDYQLLLARELGYLGSEAYRKAAQELDEVRKMLEAFVRRVRLGAAG